MLFAPFIFLVWMLGKWGRIPEFQDEKKAPKGFF
tara:strand:- start:69 stop:170 length:102 start_codon:yes stop_codon:yes gene_type:complete